MPARATPQPVIPPLAITDKDTMEDCVGKLVLLSKQSDAVLAVAAGELTAEIFTRLHEPAKTSEKNALLQAAMTADYCRISVPTPIYWQRGDLNEQAENAAILKLDTMLCYLPGVANQGKAAQRYSFKHPVVTDYSSVPALWISIEDLQGLEQAFPEAVKNAAQDKSVRAKG